MGKYILSKKTNKIVSKSVFRQPIITIDNTESRMVTNTNPYWSWGDDNILPYAIAALNRKSNVNRAILNNKSNYVAGNTYTSKSKELLDYLLMVNNKRETFRTVLKRLAYDYLSQGNGYMEAVTNKAGNFLNLFHHDCTTCRVGKGNEDKGYVLLHPDWSKYDSFKDEVRKVPLYPNIEARKDGYYHTMIHFKDYEQMFVHYGVISWVAGLNIAAIAYKTDKWNVSRLDNSFAPSTIVKIGGEFDSDNAANELAEELEKQYSGDGMAGKTMFLVKNGDVEKQSEVITLNDNKDGDWKGLHEVSTNDLIIAHNWFRSLSGIVDNTGFDTKRILNEYEVAINTVINDIQALMLNPIKEIIQGVRGWDTSDLEIVNKPPISIAGLIDVNAVLTIDEGRELLGKEPLGNTNFIKSGTVKEATNGI